MGNRLTKIYTRTGDDGTTSLDGRHRLAKNSTHIEAVGTVDELNSVIGMVVAASTENKDVQRVLQDVQQDLFNVGGELCPPHHVVMTSEKISALERELDRWNETLPPLKEFILPGGNMAAAMCHTARAVCRRAERCLVALHQEIPLNQNLLCYVNRLSDLLFVAARIVNQGAGKNEILWEHERKK